MDIHFQRCIFNGAYGAMIKERLHNYLIGFVSCIFLSIAGYSIAVSSTSNLNYYEIGVVGILALSQLTIQGIFFLHLSLQKKDRYRLIIAGLIMLIITILVSGSIWIMNNLNSHMMPDASRMNQYIKSQDGL